MRWHPRSRSRKRGRRSGWLTVAAVVALGVLVASSVVVPTASVSHGSLSRGSGVDTVGDETAVQGLDTAPAVHVNATSVLTNVTNRFGQTVTVTVTLRDDADHVGDLVVDGNVVGNSTSFTLGSGQAEVVSIEIPDDQSLTDDVVYFHVEAAGGGVAGRTPDRSVPVDG